jgi:hypothetical protein
MLQAAQGVPLPDATQFDLVNRLYQGVVMAVFLALERCAAQGRSFFFDDTPSRILEQMALNKTCDNKKDKRAVHATALVSEYQDNTIYLFKTNTQTAGAEFKTLLSGRETDAEYMSMSDALSHNFPTMEESLMARWIITLCLVHGRRNFIHCLDAGDDNAKFVINTLAQVYEHEAHCKKAKLNTVDRLHYHQKHSAPLMAALKRWMNNLILHKSVEPNSRLGEAIAYMLKRWHELTQFLRVAGAQLDNNIAEQTIKVLIRYRKNAYFYRTFYGAEIGDAMMSVLHTAARHGISIFDYVNTLQSHREQVRTSPEDWLPWNVEETLNQLEAYREAA